jgi:hypothetical protein
MKDPDVPEPVRVRLKRLWDEGDPDGNFNFVMVECARGMFDLMLRYFLPRVPYPFTGLGLFPEAERK